MVQETFNPGNKSILRRNHGTDTAFELMTEVPEPLEAPMKLRPVLTNIGISLLVMALLAVCFRF
jgi:hypothetical protein